MRADLLQICCAKADDPLSYGITDIARLKALSFFRLTVTLVAGPLELDQSWRIGYTQT